MELFFLLLTGAERHKHNKVAIFPILTPELDYFGAWNVEPNGEEGEGNLACLLFDQQV